MTLLKAVHVGCALLSITGFFSRGILMIKGSSLLQAGWIRITPHIIDTVLLASAIALASQWGWQSLQQPWLQTKIIALLVYIGLGMLALRRGRSRRVRVLAWFAALVVFFYIVAVAISKSPFVYW